MFRQKNIGFIFQAYNLLPMLTTLENVSYPLILRGMDKKERIRRSLRAIQEVGLKGYEERKPSQMSGGQQQRVGIARALVVEPKIIFADEPTGNLDPLTGAELVELLYTICKEENTTIIMATHNLGWIDAFPGKVLAISQNKLCSGTKDECIFDY